MKRHFVRNLCSNMYRKYLLSSGLVVAHKPLELQPFQHFPATSREGMLHLLVMFVCSSLLLDSDIFTYFCPLWAVFSLLLSASLWGGPWKVLLLPLIESFGEAQNRSLDLRASRSPLFLRGTSVRVGWLALDSKRFPAQRSLARCPAFSVSSGAAQRSGVPCGALLSWVLLPGKSLFHSVLSRLRMSLSSLASLLLSGGSRCTAIGTCLWRTWKLSSQKCSNKPGQQQTDTAAGELWTWFGGRSVLPSYFRWGFHMCNPGRDFGDQNLSRCSCSAKVGSSGNWQENTGCLHTVLLGGSSRCWSGRRICHTQMRGKHASRFCAVFGLDLLELVTDVDEECVPCELFYQLRQCTGRFSSSCLSEGWWVAADREHVCALLGVTGVRIGAKIAQLVFKDENFIQLCCFGLNILSSLLFCINRRSPCMWE